MKCELSLRQQRAMDYLLKHGKITNKEYREINPDIKERAALNALKELSDKGLISLKGKGRYTHYVLS
jgi:ATP-dependent DNA helicase RecG